MGSFFIYKPEEFFTDELYSDILESTTVGDRVAEIVKPLLGDCIIYNKELNEIYINKYLDIDKEKENSVIGIVILTNEDYTIDCIMKNFLTADIQRLPISTMYSSIRSSSTGLAYMKLQFDRYIQKYKRECNMEFVKNINYYIPNVVLLDYLYKNLDIIQLAFEKIYGESKCMLYINRYLHGILSQYKNKIYIWKPMNNKKKREIMSLQNQYSCEFLPWFTITYN